MSTTGATDIDQHVFDCGPPLRLQRSLGLTKPGQERVASRAFLGAAIAWLPLAALAIAQSIVFSGTTAKSFFGDFAVHARYLIAMPALIVAEADCIPKLERIVRNFVDAGLIADSDMVRYQYAVASTHRILDSRYGDLVAPVIAYVIIVATRFYVSPDLFPDWQRAGHSYYSLTGWWHVLISLPLLLILFFGWLWRLALWARFLFLMASLNLQLIPSHPDHVGGLKFVSSSLRGFRLISLGLGAVVRERSRIASFTTVQHCLVSRISRWDCRFSLSCCLPGP